MNITSTSQDHPESLYEAKQLLKRIRPHIAHKRDCLANAVDNYPLELRELNKLISDIDQIIK